MNWSVASNIADVVVALTALAGSGFLIWDRFRPRGHGLSAWARSHPAELQGGTRVEIYAASTMPEPCMLTRVAVGDAYKLALKPSRYSMARAKLAAHHGQADEQLEWKNAVRFTRRPQPVGGLKLDGDYNPVATCFIRKTGTGERGPLHLDLEFGLTSDPRRVVKRRIEVRFSSGPSVKLAKASLWRSERVVR